MGKQGAGKICIIRLCKITKLLDKKGAQDAILTDRSSNAERLSTAACHPMLSNDTECNDTDYGYRYRVRQSKVVQRWPAMGFPVTPDGPTVRLVHSENGELREATFELRGRYAYLYEWFGCIVPASGISIARLKVLRKTGKSPKGTASSWSVHREDLYKLE